MLFEVTHEVKNKIAGAWEEALRIDVGLIGGGEAE